MKLNPKSRVKRPFSISFTVFSSSPLQEVSLAFFIAKANRTYYRNIRKYQKAKRIGLGFHSQHTCNSSSRGSDTISWPLWAPDMQISLRSPESLILDPLALSF
ncbi:mCG1050910 [Mus musculus]|nr:mCG1050910 [Mus musculus]